jgi:hypothetical protein
MTEFVCSLAPSRAQSARCLGEKQPNLQFGHYSPKILVIYNFTSKQKIDSSTNYIIEENVKVIQNHETIIQFMNFEF